MSKIAIGSARQGRELLGILIVKKAGKAIAGEPKDGAHTIAMKPGVSWFGDDGKALVHLAKAFPGCKFAWEKPAA